MQKWEYMYYQVHNELDVPGKIDAYYREETISIKHVSLIELLNDAGEKGWELVSAPPKTADIFRMFVFKRPVA